MFWHIRGKLYAYQVINIICILQFLIDSYISDEKSRSSTRTILCVLIVNFSSCLKNCFEFRDHTLSGPFLIIMKSCFIIIIIAQRVYGPKIKKKILDMKKKLVSTHTRKNFYRTGFFHQMYNYQSKTTICKWY